MREGRHWFVIAGLVLAIIVVLVYLVVRRPDDPGPMPIASSETMSPAPMIVTCSPDPSHKLPWTCSPAQQQSQEAYAKALADAQQEAETAIREGTAEFGRLAVSGAAGPSPALKHSTAGKRLSTYTAALAAMKKFKLKQIGAEAIVTVNFKPGIVKFEDGARMTATVCQAGNGSRTLNSAGKIVDIAFRYSTFDVAVQRIAGHWFYVESFGDAPKEVATC